MAFRNDRHVVRDAIARDPAFAGLDLSEALADMDAQSTVDGFLLSAMRVLAPACNGHSRVIPNAAIRVWPVRIICLLYTSPSPRDLSTSRMPSSA